jgi:maltose O-acetyltransferase
MTFSEKRNMLAGELYRSTTDPELQTALAKAQQQLRRLNAIPNEDTQQRFAILQAMLGQIGSGTQIKSPFSCDYGLQIRIGSNGFVNYGCVFLECNLITIGRPSDWAGRSHLHRSPPS